MFLQTAADDEKVCLSPQKEHFLWNIIIICLLFYDFSICTWYLAILLRVLDHMEVVGGGLGAYPHAREVSLQQIPDKDSLYVYLPKYISLIKHFIDSFRRCGIHRLIRLTSEPRLEFYLDDLENTLRYFVINTFMIAGDIAVI